MSAEEWRAIPGWPGYMASNQGHVRSHRRDVEGRPMVAARNPQNHYFYVQPRRNGKQEQLAIHVAVTLAFHGPRPAGAVVRHLDGSRDNNVPENLTWGTYAENLADRALHGFIQPRRSVLRGTCAHGHPYTPENTATDYRGYPRCRACDREQTAARRLKRRLEIAQPTTRERAA